jgi:hypothetical protein
MREEVDVARGSSKLGGLGRGRKTAEAQPTVSGTEQQDGFPIPAVPSSARNILPGEPFEPASAGLPAPRSGDSFAGPGWGAGAPGLPGDPVGLNPLGFEPSTGPLPAVPGGPLPGDPLDALQQYAGMPSAFGTGYASGAAPAPDPTQLYQPFPGPAAPDYSGGTGYPATSAYGTPEGSGFADGGIFTGEAFGSDNLGGPTFGADPLDGASPQGEHFGAGAPGPAGSASASTMLADPSIFGADEHSLGLPPMTAAAPTITPGSPFEPAPGFGVDSDMLVEEQGGRGRRRRNSKARRTRDHEGGATTGGSGGGSRRAVALLGIAAILGGAGFVGYTQLGGSEDELVSSGPVTRAPAGTAATGSAPATYATPKQLATFSQVAPDALVGLTRDYTSLAKQNLPGLPAPMTVSAYHTATSPAPVINVVVYAPSARSDAAYNQLVAQLSRPGEGTVSVPAVPVAPGASGGTLLCGSQRGASNSAWCAWKSDKGVGFLQTRGSSNQNNAAVLTRELRAYAER